MRSEIASKILGKTDNLTRCKVIAYSFELISKKMTIQEVKKELDLTDKDIAEFFQYANAVSYANSARKKKLDSGIIKLFLKCKQHFSLNVG